jgi:hypothetical protein
MIHTKKFILVPFERYQALQTSGAYDLPQSMPENNNHCNISEKLQPPDSFNNVQEGKGGESNDLQLEKDQEESNSKDPIDTIENSAISDNITFEKEYKPRPPPGRPLTQKIHKSSWIEKWKFV